MAPPLERKRLQTSAGEMAFVDMGDGRPVLLLHGFPTSSHLWRKEAWLLAQRMRVVAPDLIGYGDSAKPDGMDVSPRAQSLYVRELLASLQIDALAVVGHDVGGAIAQLIALENGGPQLKALILIDSWGMETPPTEVVRRANDVSSDQQTAEAAREIVHWALDRGIAHRERLPDEELAGYLRPWLDDPQALFRAAKSLAVATPGGDAELADLDIPALIIWGETDPFLPSGLAEQIGDQLDGSTIALLPGCSHFVNEDAPQVVGPLVYEYLRVRYLEERHDHGGEPVAVFLEPPPAAFG